MEIVLKAAAGALISVVLGLVVTRHSKESALLLTVAVCCMITAAMLTYLSPALEFFQKLKLIGNLDSDILSILLKSTGIALLSEITSLICTDAGNAALGKVLQLLAAVVILWLSIPLLNRLIDLLENILVSV